MYQGLDDPEAFGGCMLDFDMSEPLGAVADHLRFDEQGLGWWGTLNAELPKRPD